MANYIVSSGDVESGIILENDTMTILDGGVASTTTVNSRGYFYISSGGVANSTTVNSYGHLYVYSDGTASNTTVNSYGKLSISSGGVANSTTVNYDGRFYVSSGGVANSTTVNSGGNLYVSSGGTATEIVENGGYVWVADGANVTFTPNTISGLVLSNASATVHSGTTANHTAVNQYGSMTVFSGGIANSTTVNNGKLYVYSGGIIIGRVFVNRGSISAAEGAIMDFDLTSILPGAAAWINDYSRILGTPVYTLTINEDQADGVYTLAANAVDFNQTITVTNSIGESLGTLSMGESITISGKAYTLGLADSVLSLKVGEGYTPSPYTSDGLVVVDGTATMEADEVFHDTLILSGTLNILSGGTATNTTVNATGKLEVNSGGTANGTTVNSSGYLYVSSGGMTAEIVENGGHVDVKDGADVTFVSNTFSGLVLSNASATVHSGTTANHTTVNSKGTLYVYSGGVANSTTVNKNGCLYVSSGGVANSTTVNQYGSMTVFSGGIANSTTVNFYVYLRVSSGGTANSTTVNSKGTLYVSSGGTATTTTVNSYGGMRISSDGTATTTTVNSGGFLQISSGGTATDTTVNSGGELYVFSGGTATGQMIFEDGAIVSAFDDAILDFDISSLTPEAGARVNNLAIIRGTPLYTLTVSAEQAKGVYKLAEGAASFDSTITVQNTLGETLGTLTVGETLSVGDTDYTLNLGTETAADALTLTVEQNDTTAPAITLSADTETVLKQTTLTATVDDGSQIYYRISEFGNWKKYTEPIIASLNETYYFKATDEGGNTGTNQITFGNIDTTGIMLSTFWAQSGVCPMGGNTTIEYNEYTPYDPTVTPDTHSKTGCSNTAVGQLIYYFIEKQGLDLALMLEQTDEYTYSHRGEGDEPISIKINADGSTPGTLSFAAINDLLADFKLDSAEHAAALLYACGVVQKSKYGASSTGTSWKKTVFTRSGLACVILDGPFFENYWGGPDDEYKYHISDAGFEVLIENLEAGRPVGVSFPGHALVIDGYDRESDTFHINYGWSYNQATRWYTREEMFEQQFYQFVYDLMTDYVETFTVTDARVYGTGTMVRAFEQAYGMLGANTVAFDVSVAGKTVELQDMIMLREETAVNGFNMNVLVVNAFIHSMPSYGFYVYEDGGALTFHAFEGSLIVSTSNEYNHAFNLSKAASCTVDAGNMLIYAGKSSDDAGAAAVLQALQTCRSAKTEVSEDLLDSNGWSYFGSAGNDVLSLSNLSIAVGNVSLGDGDDVLSLAGYSRLYGTIDAGDGDDSITVDSTSSISGDLFGKSKLNFVLSKLEDHALFTIRNSVSDLYSNATLSVDMTDAGIGTYTLVSAASGATGIADLQNMVFTVTGSEGPDFTLSMNGTSTSVFADLIYEDNSLKLQVKKKSALVVPQTQTWEKIGEVTHYVVEYSTDNFGHVVQLNADTNALDSYQLPAGSYQVRVKADDGEWTVIEPVDAPDVGTVPKIVKSNEDGNSDVFYAKASGTWENIYYAQHVGSVNDWNGTKEIVSAKGKNRLADLFFGSDDANILCLTDDENGDGVFVDDEFTQLPDGIEWQQARLAQIDEIRAGAGDDIVDMTSQQFEYAGSGLTIRGGDGNDTIWANKGDNWLFGDAGNDRIVGASSNDVFVGGIGNDRMHGGGGEDIFTFCDNWGNDEIEQLAGGKVTLWFASGSMENWDKTTLTYTDGDNRVKVSGVTAEQVNLKFGDDGSNQFATLSGMGAFFDATTERIFEESGKGILASL